jgi:hypothetical protein
LSFSKRSLFDALAPALSSKETFIERSLSLRLGGTAMVALDGSEIAVRSLFLSGLEGT